MGGSAQDTNPSLAASQQERPLGDIFADYDQARYLTISETAASELDLDGAWQRIGEKDPALLESLYNYDESTSDAAAWTTILDGTRDVASPEEVAALANYMWVMHSTENTVTALVQEGLKPAQRAYEQERQAIIMRIKWDELVDGYVANTLETGPQQSNDLELGKSLGQLLMPQPDESLYAPEALFTQTRTMIERLAITKNRLIELGMFEGDIDNGFEMTPSRDAVGDIETDLREARDTLKFLAIGERREVLDRAIQAEYTSGSRLDRLIRIAHQLGADGHSEDGQRQIPRKVLRAIYRTGREFISSFDRLDDELRSRQESSPRGAIMVVGAQRLMATTNEKNPQSWAWRQLARLPRWLYGHPGVIRFVDGIEDKPAAGVPKARNGDDLPDDGEVWEVVGRRKDIENEIVVSVRGASFLRHRERLAREGKLDTEAELRDTYEQRISGAFIHEIGHYATTYTIPLKQLRLWRQVHSSYPDDVTDYAAKHRRESGEVLAMEEDFSETLELFMNRPSQLLIRSLPRFLYMNSLLGRFDSQTVDKASQLFFDRERSNLETYAELSRLFKQEVSENPGSTL